MANLIINLKNNSNKKRTLAPRATASPRVTSGPASVSAPVEAAVPHVQPEPPVIAVLENARLTWLGYEHGQRARTSAWFLIPIGCATLFVLIGIFTHNYFFVGFVGIALVTVMFSALREPRTLQCAVTEEAIMVGSKEYSIADCKSFWIFETPVMRALSLETTSMMMPYVQIPIGDTDSERIRQELIRLLPERERQQTLSEHVARILGF